MRFQHGTCPSTKGFIVGQGWIAKGGSRPFIIPIIVLLTLLSVPSGLEHTYNIQSPFTLDNTALVEIYSTTLIALESHAWLYFVMEKKYIPDFLDPCKRCGTNYVVYLRKFILNKQFWKWCKNPTKISRVADVRRVISSLLSFILLISSSCFLLPRLTFATRYARG